MEEARLDNEMQGLQKNLSFLWENYNFHVGYFTRSFGFHDRGFIIGLENDICKLVFAKETNSIFDLIVDHIGKKSASFRPPSDLHLTSDGWYSLTGLIYWLSGVEYESVKNADQDLENLGKYLKPHMDKLLDLFGDPNEFENRLEYYRNLYKGKQITIDQIKAERARLQAQGQDWSVEAAITSLRGGKK